MYKITFFDGQEMKPLVFESVEDLKRMTGGEHFYNPYHSLELMRKLDIGIEVYLMVDHLKYFQYSLTEEGIRQRYKQPLGRSIE